MAGKQSPAADGAVAGAPGHSSLQGRLPDTTAGIAHKVKLRASPAAKAEAASRGLPSEPLPVAPLPPLRELKRRARRERALDLLATLRGLWSQAFAVPPKPLAIGVHQQITQALGEMPELGAALTYWCSRNSYVRAVSCGQERVNLDGTIAGPMAAEHRDGAVRRLRALRGGAP